MIKLFNNELVRGKGDISSLKMEFQLRSDLFIRSLNYDYHVPD